MDGHISPLESTVVLRGLSRRRMQDVCASANCVLPPGADYGSLAPPPASRGVRGHMNMKLLACVAALAALALVAVTTLATQVRTDSLLW